MVVVEINECYLRQRECQWVSGCDLCLSSWGWQDLSLAKACCGEGVIKLVAKACCGEGVIKLVATSQPSCPASCVGTWE